MRRVASVLASHTSATPRQNPSQRLFRLSATSSHFAHSSLLPCPLINKSISSLARLAQLVSLFALVTMSVSSTPGNLADAPSPDLAPANSTTASSSTPVRAPAIYFSHGGGPCFFMEGGFMKNIDKNSPTAAWYRRMAHDHVPTKPKAIVIISAHWEESKIHITSKPKPALYFDYYGFPAHTYQLTYPAPCDTELAQRIYDILTHAGVPAKLDNTRDWDHGVFVPLKLIYPDADVPLVQISLNHNLDPALHYRIGELLGPLRDENIAIFGSGFATHNMRELMTYMGVDDVVPTTRSWVDWLTETVTMDDPKTRKERLIEWEKAPYARRAHPREEHLLPLHIVAGTAANSDKGAKEIYSFIFGAAALNCYKFE